MIFLSFIFILFSINNCPKNPKYSEIKKIISELNSHNEKLELNIQNLKIAAKTKELFIETIDNEFENENAKLKQKYVKLKEKYANSRNEKIDLVKILHFTYFQQLFNNFNL